jgi:uncharacterized protein (DUF924 family)
MPDATLPVQPEAVLAFWFDEIDPKLWFARSDEFDQLLLTRFGATHAAAERCELAPWRATAPGRLAEVMVLDQFSRNLHRHQPRAFANDALALALAQTAVACGADQQLEPVRRAFLYMPYMHSESALIHAEAVRLFSAPGLEDNLNFELRHQAIITRFGRYPHRNTALGRPSTPEEIEFLETPGSGF